MAFTEKVIFEKEANCVAIWRKACPRQGEQPGQRLEAYLMGSWNSEGGIWLKQNVGWGQRSNKASLCRALSPGTTSPCLLGRRGSPPRDLSPGHDMISICRGLVWPLGWLDSEWRGGRMEVGRPINTAISGSCGAVTASRGGEKWSGGQFLGVIWRWNRETGWGMGRDSEASSKRGKELPSTEGGRGCRWSIFLGEEQEFGPCWVLNVY